MNKKLIIGVGVVAGMVSGLLQAEESFYVSGGLGMAYAADADIDVAGATEVESDLGYMVRGAIGHQFEGGFRLETEASLRSNGIDKINGVDATGDVDIQAVMVNAIFDIDTQSNMKPYIGLGGGAAAVTYDGVNVATDTGDTAHAWQLMLGLGFEMDPNTTLSVGYRYFDVGEVEIGNFNMDVDHASHDFEVGMRFNF